MDKAGSCIATIIWRCNSVYELSKSCFPFEQGSTTVLVATKSIYLSLVIQFGARLLLQIQAWAARQDYAGPHTARVDYRPPWRPSCMVSVPTLRQTGSNPLPGWRGILVSPVSRARLSEPVCEPTLGVRALPQGSPMMGEAPLETNGGVTKRHARGLPIYRPTKASAASKARRLICDPCPNIAHSAEGFFRP